MKRSLGLSLPSFHPDTLSFKGFSRVRVYPCLLAQSVVAIFFLSWMLNNHKKGRPNMWKMLLDRMSGQCGKMRTKLPGLVSHHWAYLQWNLPCGPHVWEPSDVNIVSCNPEKYIQHNSTSCFKHKGLCPCTYLHPRVTFLAANISRRKITIYMRTKQGTMSIRISVEWSAECSVLRASTKHVPEPGALQAPSGAQTSQKNGLLSQNPKYVVTYDQESKGRQRWTPSTTLHLTIFRSLAVSMYMHY